MSYNKDKATAMVAECDRLYSDAFVLLGEMGWYLQDVCNERSPVLVKEVAGTPAELVVSSTVIGALNWELENGQ